MNCVPSWRDPCSPNGRLDNPHSLSITAVLCCSEGDAGSSHFPPLAPIIASSIQDVSGSDRGCLITTSSPLHGRQIGSTCRISALSSFCRPGSLMSFDTVRQILPLSSTVALFVFFPSFFFYLFSFSRCDLYVSDRYLVVANLGSSRMLHDTPDPLFPNQQFAYSMDHYGSTWESCLQLYLQGHH